MTTIQISVRLDTRVIGALDAIASWANLSAGGVANASRSSVAASLITQHALGHPAVGKPEAPKGWEVMEWEWPRPPVAGPLPPVAEKLTDGERLRRALGSMAPGSLDRELGMGKGTTRNCLRGGVPIASAGKGKLLAWVVAQEADAAARARV